MSTIITRRNVYLCTEHAERPWQNIFPRSIAQTIVVRTYLVGILFIYFFHPRRTCPRAAHRVPRRFDEFPGCSFRPLAIPYK